LHIVRGERQASRSCYAGMGHAIVVATSQHTYTDISILDHVPPGCCVERAAKGQAEPAQLEAVQRHRVSLVAAAHQGRYTAVASRGA
jgi:hypothetical protein